MSEWTYIWAAYAITWVTLLGYTLYVNRRVRRAGKAECTFSQGDPP
jgi:CcmD family protein